MHCERKTVHKQFAFLQELFCFSHSEQHQIHDDAFRNHAPATIKMPGDDKNSFRFKNFKARWFAPITTYFDFESFLMPVSSSPSNPDASS